MMRWSYFRLLLKSEDEIGELQALHPMESKKSLSESTHFFQMKQKELASFAQVFSKGETLEEMKTYKLSELSLDPESMTLLSRRRPGCLIQGQIEGFFNR